MTLNPFVGCEQLKASGAEDSLGVFGLIPIKMC